MVTSLASVSPLRQPSDRAKRPLELRERRREAPNAPERMLPVGERSTPKKKLPAGEPAWDNPRLSIAPPCAPDLPDDFNPSVGPESCAPCPYKAGKARSVATRIGEADDYCADFSELIRQTALPVSSATSSAPVRSSATPTGRPRTVSLSSPRNPVTTGTGLPSGRPFTSGTKIT